MYGKALSIREARSILKNNGFKENKNRGRGDHLFFEHRDGRTVVITDGKLSMKTWNRECKKASIVY